MNASNDEDIMIPLHRVRLHSTKLKKKRKKNTEGRVRRKSSIGDLKAESKRISTEEHK